MVFINNTGIISNLVSAMTTNLTGSEFITYLVILFGLFLFMSMFNFTNEIAVILLIPVVLVLMAYSNDWKAVGGIFLIYISIYIVDHFPGR